MPTELLSCGVPHALTTNRVYALPVCKTTVFTGDSSPALEQSNVLDFSTKSAVTLTGGMASLAGGFMRATTGTPIVILSRD